MTATTLTSGAVPRPIRGVIGMLRDTWVVAKRNLRRMTRIPNPVRPSRSGFTSARGRSIDVTGAPVGSGAR
jgi:hypothetical protein